MYTLRQYLATLSDSRGLTRTLGEIDVCRDAAGRPLYTAGNSAVVFRIRHAGRLCSLRCYTRPMRHLAEIYGAGFLPGELFLHTSPTEGVWVDAVLSDWIEGKTLHEAIVQAAGKDDAQGLARLSEAFDRLALALLCDDRAHGDLKPENLIVDTQGALRPIDLDASFLPTFAGERSPELGTAAFQHPERTAADFDARLDDYPVALIATALHALTLDPTLYQRHGDTDGLLFTPRSISTDPALHEVLTLFERRAEAASYRIARLLLSPTLGLPGLPELLAGMLRKPAPHGGQTPELFVENGLWGYRTDDRVVIPALYDNGFDFSEGLAAVCLGHTWHFIDTTGRTVFSCPGCEAVKPFRNGHAQALRHGVRTEFDPTGRELTSVL